MEKKLSKNKLLGLMEKLQIHKNKSKLIRMAILLKLKLYKGKMDNNKLYKGRFIKIEMEMKSKKKLSQMNKEIKD